MYGITPFILIFLPIIFQIIYGRKSIGEDIKLKLSQVCIISFLAQIILSIIAYQIASYNFYKNLNGDKYHCGMGLLGIIGLDLIVTIFLLIVMIVQFFIWRSYRK